MAYFHWVGQTQDKKKVILHRFENAFHFAPYATSEWIQTHKPQIVCASVLDLETTGMSPATDKILEIALVTFLFDKTNGALLKIQNHYQAFQDPLGPIASQIQLITGITNEMVQGKQIDWERVNALLRESAFLIAHNAQFDRAFLDRVSSVSKQKPWGCSYKQVPWLEYGYASAKLELLSIYHGFFVGAHRALEDVKALLHLLTFQKQSSFSKTYLLDLYQNAQSPHVRIFAYRAPFQAKDFLKARHYYWNPKIKCWHRTIQKSQLESEMAFLESQVYQGSFLGKVQPLAPQDLFKEQIT